MLGEAAYAVAIAGLVVATASRVVRLRLRKARDASDHPAPLALKIRCWYRLEAAAVAVALACGLAGDLLNR